MAASDQAAATAAGEDRAERLRRLRHSAAHVMAQAVMEHFADEGAVHVAIGPPTEKGFYYDFELPRPATDADLEHIEARMREVLGASHRFEYQEVDEEEARELFGDQPFKLEIIDSIVTGGVDEHGDPLPEGQRPQIGTYRHDDFVDLCRGPHVDSTEQISPDAVKLLGVSGAYWRGDEHKPMLQRIYGTAWESPKELRTYLWQLEEAEKRDHRRLGRELELFFFDETAPGMPYWLPRGLTLFNELLAFWRTEHEARGYQEVATPLVSEKSLWETSGHWDHYKDNMFLVPDTGERVYGLKPMNCPNAMLVYKWRTRSYRDLPLRISDCDPLHRNERSGTLHGLLRVQAFRQDDAHIFLTRDQLGDEFNRLFELIDHFYRVFGMSYRLRLGTRPGSFVGEPADWDEAEAVLKGILDERLGADNWEIAEGDGAFYGPKIDILMQDSLERDWQMGTLQLDFQLPARFGCVYADADGQQRTPVVIHRVIYGSLERFIGVLIEHTGGAFPPWVAPEQLRVVPVSEDQLDYAEEVHQRARDAGLRAELDRSDGSLSSRVRQAQVMKIPYVFVVGGREREQGSVNVRLHGEKKQRSLPLGEAIDTLVASMRRRDREASAAFGD